MIDFYRPIYRASCFRCGQRAEREGLCPRCFNRRIMLRSICEACYVVAFGAVLLIALWLIGKGAR